MASLLYENIERKMNRVNQFFKPKIKGFKNTKVNKNFVHQQNSQDIGQGEIAFCGYIQRLNNHHTNNERKNAYNEIKFLKDTLKSLKRLKQTKEVKNRINEVKKKIKFYEDSLSSMGNITNEELIENLKRDKRIEFIDFNREVITIKTNDINFCGYNIGKYYIIIDFRRREIRMERVDKITINGFSHVFIKHRNPCFGDKNPAIRRSLEYGGFYSIINVCMSLLSSIESVHEGAYITSKEFLKRLQSKMGGISNGEKYRKYTSDEDYY